MIYTSTVLWLEKFKAEYGSYAELFFCFTGSPSVIADELHHKAETKDYHSGRTLDPKSPENAPSEEDLCSTVSSSREEGNSITYSPKSVYSTPICAKNSKDAQRVCT